MQVNCGTVGISNLMKRHCRTKKCLELKARWDKKGKGMVQGSLLTFMKPKPTLVPLTVAGTSLIQSNMISAIFSTADIPYKQEFEERVEVSLENGPINGRSQFIGFSVSPILVWACSDWSPDTPN
jgi:hypothetical protein